MEYLRLDLLLHLTSMIISGGVAFAICKPYTIFTYEYVLDYYMV